MVLDGIHRLAPGVLAVLQTLIFEREITLFDGTKLLRPERWDALVQMRQKVLGGPVHFFKNLIPFLPNSPFKWT